MNKIADTRKRFAISQAQLVKKLGWKQSRLSNYENGLRSLSVKDAEKIVTALQELGAKTSFREVFLQTNDLVDSLA